MTTTFAIANARRANLVYYWVEIEGLRYRYGSIKAGADAVFDAWNPADSGNNRHIRPWLNGYPAVGGQTADPLNGECSIPSHSFSLFDKDDTITAMVAVSDTPFNKTFLTASIEDDDVVIPVEATDGFAATGYFYLDRETIIYSGKGSDSDTDTCATYERTGLVADAGTIYHIMDAALAEDNIGQVAGGAEGRSYWAGAYVVVTAGTNNGETRRVRNSYYDVDNSYGVLILDSPMPAANDATTTYSITPAPTRIKTTTLAGADDTWKGAVLTVTAGTNIGQTRWVYEWDLSEDLLTLVSPFPEPCDSTSQFAIVLATFTGCTRGAFRSVAKSHYLIDENKALIKRPVVDKVPFLKTRRVWIYENRVGCAEAQALCTGGFINDHVLSHNLTCYTFSCSGVLSRLSGKLLADPAVTRIRGRRLWGGYFEIRHGVNYETRAIGASFYIDGNSGFHVGMKMSDGSLAGFTVDCIAVENIHDFPLNGGHVKVDEELIYYNHKKHHQDTDDLDLMNLLVLGEMGIDAASNDVRDYWHYENRTFPEEDMSALAGFGQRGLFSELIGTPNLKNNWTIAEGTKGYIEHNGGHVPAFHPEVSGLTTEHDVGAEVKQAIACYDSSRSEFVRYDRITYENISGAGFNVGDTITGGTSGNTAVVMYDVVDSYMYVAFMDDEKDAFVAGEVISGSGQTADVLTYTKEIRPRNNAIDAFLQLLLSTGTVGANGMYDTMPTGLGLGLDESYVDVSGIETLRDKYFAGTQIHFVIHEPTEAQEFFQEAIFKPLQIFPFENTAGQISLGYLMTYNEADVQNGVSALESLGSGDPATPLPDWTSGKPPVGKLTIKYNRHPCKDEYLGEIDVIFGNVRDWYEDLGRNITLEMPTLYSPDRNIRRARHRDPRLPMLLRRMLGIVWDRYAQHPCPVISYKGDYSTVTLNIGDPVLFTQANMPNMRTSLRGLTDEYFQILGKTQNPEAGTVEFILWQIGVHDAKFGRRCPSCMVASYTADNPIAGKSRIVTYSSVFSPPGTNDAASFNDGDIVMFLDDVYDKLSTPIETYEVDSVSGNTIYLTSNVTTPPAAGYFLEFADYDSVQTSQKSARVFMADSKRVLGAGNVSGYKYL